VEVLDPSLEIGLLANDLPGTGNAVGSQWYGNRLSSRARPERDQPEGQHKAETDTRLDPFIHHLPPP